MNIGTADYTDGTDEASKLAPVIRELRHPDRVVCKVCVTAQYCLGEPSARRWWTGGTGLTAV